MIFRIVFLHCGFYSFFPPKIIVNVVLPSSFNVLGSQGFGCAAVSLHSVTAFLSDELFAPWFVIICCALCELTFCRSLSVSVSSLVAEWLYCGFCPRFLSGVGLHFCTNFLTGFS